ncbi:hypothetical protein OS188_14255, partial [Xanthomarina sp. F1114]|uniref:leucine-rich repeat domain-containing protein n=1 Tax=Xanthomarina sp. F1114 TaxID=2996019 RepID=UPI003A4C50F3|nr:hypothetical protein [Xanthomarina sp. F1114]
MLLNRPSLSVFTTILFSLFGMLFGHSQTTAIPDTNFEQELIALGVDTNGLNGNILNADALAITTLSLGGTSIADITGIEAFTNLTNLNLGNNPVVNINLIALTQLTDFTTDNNDALSSINFSQNLLLENVFIESDLHNAGDAPIILIDLSQNTSLISLEVNRLANLSDLILPITSTLTTITLSNLADPTLDFSQLDGLEILFIRGSHVPVTITLPNEQAILKNISFNSIDLPTVDVSHFINLERLDLHGTYLENLILPTTNTFKRLVIWHHNFINPLSLANVPEVEHVDIRFNQTVPLVIDLLNNPLIETLWLTHNDLNSVDLTQITNLETLWIYDNNLTALDLTQNLLLDRLSANDNLLPSIDLTQNAVLRHLNLADNQIPSLDLTQNPVLNSVNISNNLFTGTGLDLTQNAVLSTFMASFNQIESLDITQNVVLTRLIVDHNLFTGTSILDQFYTVRLNHNGIYGGSLDVSYNQLTGMIPDYASLIDGDVNDGNQTRRFSLIIDNNNFEFGHFENQHADYVLFDNTIGPAPFFSEVILDYSYAPQAKVDVVETINANAGDSVTLTTACAGAQNHYTWFKDGVAIPGAPDSPNYTIPSVNSCDEAVYHTEILSDLIPFENTNPPGTDGRNLLLIRNDITLNVNSPVESCVSLTSPTNGSVLVPINEILSWTESLGACGYYISIGTTSGGTDILNNVDVGNVNSYALTTDFPPNTQVFVTITPYFANGVTLTCPEESFTTDSVATIANCTTLISPLNGETDVLISSDITWTAILNASGYFITIGTSSGASDLANAVDVGNTTTYNPPTDFPENTEIFVSIIPYNTAGNAVGCAEESFITEGSLPTCTSLIGPFNGETDVLVDSDITWNAIANATGYLVTIGTSSGASDIANGVDVGNTTTYNPPTDFPENTEIFVSITPYNTAGNAVGCAEESFTTEALIPACTSLVSPFNGETDVLVSSDITWNAIANATGYLVTIGTSSGASDIANGVDVGNTTTYNPPTDFPENT